MTLDPIKACGRSRGVALQPSRQLARRRRSWWRTLSGLVLAGALLAPLAGFGAGVARAAYAPPSVYVTDGSSHQVSQYGLGPGGLLAPLSPAAIAAGEGPRGIAFSPDGKSLYVSDSLANVVLQYDVHPDGTLSPKSPPSVAAGTGPDGVAVSPDGKSVYVADDNSFGKVSQYDVNPADGTLSPKATPVIEAGEYAAGIAVSPDGNSLYVTNSGFSGYVYQFDIGLGGSLGPKAPERVAAGAGPVAIALSPDGTSAYVTDHSADELSQYDVDPADGTLSPKASPTVGTGEHPAGIAVSPDGHSVYVTDDHHDGTVSQFDVGAGGALTPKAVPAVAAGHNPQGVALSSDGKVAYVADSYSDAVSQYAVGAGGVLTAMAPAAVAAGGLPQGLVVSPGPTPPPLPPPPPPTPPAPTPTQPSPSAPQITAGPPHESTQTGAGFTFSGTPGGSFQCSLDGGRWQPCASGQSYRHLAPGDHLFRVRERRGAKTSAPASYRWTVDLPRKCVLRVARARVFAYKRKSKARLVIHYTSYKPARVKVSYRLAGKKGALKLGSASTRFKKAGVFRLPERLRRRQMVKLRAAKRFTVRFQIPKTPHSCGRYYTKRLTIPRKVSHQTVWFQSDSRFAPGG